eukprot:16441804-Heterocapsa_arctica.AAC.1
MQLGVGAPLAPRYGGHWERPHLPLETTKGVEGLLQLAAVLPNHELLDAIEEIIPALRGTVGSQEPGNAHAGAAEELPLPQHDQHVQLDDVPPYAFTAGPLPRTQIPIRAQNTASDHADGTDTVNARQIQCQPRADDLEHLSFVFVAVSLAPPSPTLSPLFQRP